jgi:hypothetical protein
MFCSECGQQITDDAKFCGECGAAQTSFTSEAIQNCPSCNAKGWVHGKQCRSCGYADDKEIAATNKLQTTTTGSKKSNVASYIVGALVLVGMSYLIDSHLSSNKTSQGEQIESGAEQATSYEPQQNAKLAAEAETMRAASVERESQAKLAQQNISNSKWQTGIHYSYYSSGPCSTKDNEVCITYEEYKQACDDAKGVTSSAIRMAVMLADNATKTVFEGGGIDETTVMWVPKLDACGAVLSASGIVNGNSTKKQVGGRVTSFDYVDGQLLVSYIDTIN